MSLRDLADILRVLGKYSASSIVEPSVYGVMIKEPHWKEIFDNEDLQILRQKGCEWTGEYWDVRLW